MKRRKFLKNVSGIVVTASGFGRIAAAAPCPPPTFGGAIATCGAASGNLSEVAASLSAGQSAQFTKNTLQRENDIQWNTVTIYYDQVRRELQYMGKPASSQSTNYSHYLYSEDTDTWSTSGQTLFPGTGHIWASTFDWNQGDYWFRKYNENVLRWYDRSEGTWKVTTSPSVGALNEGGTDLPALGYHPNLFGPGEPGIFVWGKWRLFAYNLGMRTWSNLSPTYVNQDEYLERSIGQAVYLPGTDQLICFASTEPNGYGNAVLVDAGAGNSSDSITAGFVSLTGSPPLKIGGYGAGVSGHVVAHPDDPNRLLCLEERGSARVWDSTDFGATWSLTGYTHPFNLMDNWTVGEWTCGIVAPYGIVVGMTSNSNGGETVLWKPNS